MVHLKQVEVVTTEGYANPRELHAQLNAEPEPNPVQDVEYTGELVTDSGAEFDALAIGLRERTKR